MSHRHSATDSAPSHVLRFPQLDREVTTRAGESILQCVRRTGVRIVGACGGRGACGSCTVCIIEGKVKLADGRVLGPREAQGDRAARGRWVRACQVVPQTDCTLEVEARSLAPVVRAEVSADGSEVLPLDPLVIGIEVAVPEPTLIDPRSDAERVTSASSVPLTSFDLVAAQELPAALRAANWSVRTLVRTGEVIGFVPAASRILGLAIDLGTTNVAGFLIDLQSGERIASLGIENPQVAWGADVISRINHAMRGTDYAEEVRASAVAAIDALAHDLCHAVGASAVDIADVAVCGNTAMHHLLLGLPVRQLGRAPFVAAAREAMDIKARDLGLHVRGGAYVHVAPNVGGFVGGDHVTALLATDAQWEQSTTSLVMDIGTNTEISLIHRGEILTASCPSGPALEGGHISCGMRAAEGAIERVAVRDGRITIGVIGDKTPVGLCGSGVLDAVAALRGAGLLDGGGRLASAHPDIAEVNGARVAVLAPDVHFSQHDVRAVQLAKAAIRTGIELLVRDAGLEESAIDRVIIAGAFGAYLDVQSGKAIGLLPDLPLDRFQQVGNAAGVGIRRMLASKQARARARELAARCRYVELSTRGDFQKVFLQNIGFRTKPRASAEQFDREHALGS